jgi:hypothetical protein
VCLLIYFPNQVTKSNQISGLELAWGVPVADLDWYHIVEMRVRISSPRLCHKPVYLLCAVLTLFVTSMAQEPSQTSDTKVNPVNVEYDEKNDITKVTLNPIVLVSRKQEELRLGVVASHRGKAQAKPTEVALVFLSLSATPGNKYESARKLTILADTQRFACGEAQRSTQTQNGVFVESLASIVPFDTFLKIVRAQNVGLKLGFTEIKLKPEQLMMLRAAASYMGE